MMHAVETGFEYISFSIDMVGVMIMLWGFLLSLKQFLVVEFSHGGVDAIMEKQLIRCRMGNYLLLSLEFMIVSDIINSVVTRSMDDILYLGVIVVIRTAIGFFLGRELGELSHNEPATAEAK
jgi:uncharacterized membrane protein